MRYTAKITRRTAPCIAVVRPVDSDSAEMKRVSTSSAVFFRVEEARA